MKRGARPREKGEYQRGHRREERYAGEDLHRRNEMPAMSLRVHIAVADRGQRLNREIKKPSGPLTATLAIGSLPSLWRNANTALRMTRRSRPPCRRRPASRRSLRDNRGRCKSRMLDRMRTGKLESIQRASGLVGRVQAPHRKDGKVVKEGGDLLCATNYALMSILTPAQTARRKPTEI
jgi:hypothetical protein